ncbi:MAG: PspA/IM30 family protein [Armatimonadota bacterium]
MAFFTRMRRLLRASLNEALDASEDPVAALNYLVLELCEHLERARTAVAAAMAAERRLAEQAENAGQAGRQWTERARRALLNGAEDLAREALRRKRAAEEMARYFGEALEEQHREVARLRSALAYLQGRLQEARMARVKLLARVETARAQQVVTRSLQQTVGKGAFEEFDRIAARIDNQQYREQALAELTIGSSEDAFVLAEQDLQVERELSMLKDELQDIAEPPALPQSDRT